MSLPDQQLSPAPTAQHPRRTRRVRGKDYVVSDWHPALDCWRQATDAEILDLARDIAANGQQEPIRRMPDGVILDGRAREIAAKVAGAKPRFRTCKLNDHEIPSLVASLNAVRKHDTDSQRGMSAAKLAGFRIGGRPDRGQYEQLTQGAASAVCGVDIRTTRRCCRILLAGTPALVDAIVNGRLDATNAERALVLSPAGQEDVALAPNPKLELHRLLKKPPRSEWSRQASYPVGRDSDGRPIPPALAEVFAAGRRLAGNARRAVHAAVEELVVEAGRVGMGPAVNPDELRVMAGPLVDALDRLVPEVLCPRTDANGTHAEPDPCPVCGGRGWLNRRQAEEFRAG